MLFRRAACHSEQAALCILDRITAVIVPPRYLKWRGGLEPLLHSFQTVSAGGAGQFSASTRTELPHSQPICGYAPLARRTPAASLPVSPRTVPLPEHPFDRAEAEVSRPVFAAPVVYPSDV